MFVLFSEFTDICSWLIDALRLDAKDDENAQEENSKETSRDQGGKQIRDGV